MPDWGMDVERDVPRFPAATHLLKCFRPGSGFRRANVGQEDRFRRLGLDEVVRKMRSYETGAAEQHIHSANGLDSFLPGSDRVLYQRL